MTSDPAGGQMPDRLPESILVATDLSESADRVVSAAAGLARAFGAELRVLHAFELSDQRYTPDGPVTPSFPTRLAETVRQLDAQVRRTRVHPDVRVSRQVVIRSPATAILELAATGFDLIVLGAHRKRGSGLPLGDTAKRVVSESSVPCLIVGPRAELPFRRVTVAHDLSERGRHAFEGALRWARASVPATTDGAQPAEAAASHLDVVHVVRSRSHGAQEGNHRALLEREIDFALPEAPGSEPLRIQPVVLVGDPARRLSAFASRHSADLVVAGTNGRGPLPKAMPGSVALSLTDSATRFVLLVPPSSPPSVPDGTRGGQTLPTLRFR